jgi:uncharacterized damage-inducible protein DinB
MRGPLEGASPFVAPLLYSFQAAREDLAHWTEGLSAGQLWRQPCGLAPAGFHVRHIGRSVDRLITYAQGSQLDDMQMMALRSEQEPGAGRDELLAELEMLLARAEERVRALPADTLTEARGVGRKKLPTTVIGLLVHTAEHTQRHVGQAITTIKVVRSGAA